MARYEVVAPCVFLDSDGSVSMQRKVGSFITLDDEIGDGVIGLRKLGDTPAPDPEPEVATAPSGQPATFVDPEPQPETAPDPEPVEVAEKPRRGRARDAEPSAN